MNRAKFFKGLNLFLAFVLLVTLVIIVWLMWQSNQSSQVDNTQVNDLYKSIQDEDGYEADDSFDYIKINKDEMEKDDQIDDDQAKKEEDKQSDESQSGDKNEDSSDKKKDEGKEEDLTEKTYHGVLEKAEGDNEYGGNYKIKNEGDTEYTYFWFDSFYAENGVDNMVGQMVEIDVEIQEDGTFIVVDGPKIV